MDDLIAAIGSPQYDEYEDEPTQEKPKLPPLLFKLFTVSTTVDEGPVSGKKSFVRKETGEDKIMKRILLKLSGRSSGRSKKDRF